MNLQKYLLTIISLTAKHSLMTAAPHFLKIVFFSTFSLQMPGLFSAKNNGEHVSMIRTAVTFSRVITVLVVVVVVVTSP